MVGWLLPQASEQELRLSLLYWTKKEPSRHSWQNRDFVLIGKRGKTVQVLSELAQKE